MKETNGPTVGKLIYLMGASGSGKDCLLQAIASRRQAPPLVPVRRYITRPVQPESEQHIEMSQEEFECARRGGEFLFSWQAYGFSYGIGRDVLDIMEKGHNAIMNGSRGYLAIAREVYPALIPVCLDAPPEILKARIIARGREKPEEAAGRLQRASEFSGAVPEGTLTIINNGVIDRAVEQLLKMADV